LAALGDIDRLHHTVNELRNARVLLATKPSQLAPLAAEMESSEETLMQVNMKGSEANLAFPGKLNELYASFLAGQDDADTPPTAQHKAMYDSLHKQLEPVLAHWSLFKSTKLTGLESGK
jgi:hypothetical protein